MKYRIGFVSNSSTSSFLVSDNKITIKQVMEKLNFISDKYHIDINHLHILRLSEEMFFKNDRFCDQFPFLDLGTILDFDEKINRFSEIKEKYSKKDLSKLEVIESYYEELHSYQEKLKKSEENRIKDFLLSEKFESEIKGMVYIIGEKDDKVIYLLENEFPDFGYYIHLEKPYVD